MNRSEIGTDPTVRDRSGFRTGVRPGRANLNVTDGRSRRLCGSSGGW